MRGKFFGSFGVKISLLMTFFMTLSFGLNLYLAVKTLDSEKRSDLQKLLLHVTTESIDEYLPKDANETTDISYLYETPHNLSILQDSEADSLKFIISKKPLEPKEGEVAVFERISDGYFLNCVSGDSKIKSAISRYAESLATQYFPLLVFAMFASFFAVSSLVKPLRELALKCKEYKEGDFFYKRGKYGGELGEFAFAFYALVDRLERFRKKEKELFRHSAHEIKTPLALMKARLELFEGDADGDKKKFVRDFEADMERLSEALRSALFFESVDFEPPTRFDVTEAIKNVSLKMEILARRKNVNIEFADDPFLLCVSKKLFEKLILALLENALTYSKEGGAIQISTNSSRTSVCVKNEKGGEKYLFSSKIGSSIIDRLSKEANFTYEVKSDDFSHEICMYFDESSSFQAKPQN